MRSKLIKKHPTVKTLSRNQIKSHIYIKSTTPYVSALKRIKKFLEELNKSSAKCVVILGMGKATEKTLSLGCHFEQQLGKKIDVFTRTVQVLDGITDEDPEEVDNGAQEEDLEITLKKRTLSGVEVRIYP